MTSHYSFPSCRLSYFISCPLLPLKYHPSWKHLYVCTWLKASSEIQFWVSHYLWEIASYMEASKLSSHKIKYIISFSVSTWDVYQLEYPSSMTWHSKLVLSLSFIPHTQISQEILIYFNSIVSLLWFPFGKHCLVQVSEQLPGWHLFPSLLQAQARLSD